MNPNNNIIIYGDTHFGISNSNEFFLKVQEEFFNNLYAYMKENDIRTLIHLGDVYDNRRVVNYKVLNSTFDFFTHRFEADPDISVYMIVGNHDAYYKNTIELNSIKVLLNWTKFKIIDTPQILNIGNTNFQMIPWMCANNQENIIKVIQESKSDICLGHFDITGFKMVEGIYSKDGLNINMFNHFNHTFSGHFHIGSTHDKITYVGSPYQLTWSDAKSQKSVIVFDGDTGEWNKLKGLSDPIFCKIENWTSNLDTHQFKDKIVKIYLTEDDDRYLFDKWHDDLISAGVHKVTIIETSLQINPDDIEIDISKDTINLLFDYVDFVYADETNSTKQDIKLLMTEIYKEAKEL